MTVDDALYRFRLRVFALAEELGNVQLACPLMGIEILRPRARRAPRMPNGTPAFIEQRVVAFALGHPGFGPNRIAAELARPKWGGIRLSPNGVWRVLRRHGLNTRARRLV